MIQPTTIFQRTQAGRDEIYQKSHGLTQSERLVLIMVDGTTDYRGIRTKLPVLTDERFGRALSSLQKKDLVLEVLLPLEAQGADEVESTVIYRFLQQDPLDPVTIISIDPEEEFGALNELAPSSGSPSPAPGTEDAEAASRALSSAAEAYSNALEAEIAAIDAYTKQRATPDTHPFTPAPAKEYEGTERRKGADRRQDLLGAAQYQGVERRRNVDRRQEAQKESGLDGLHVHWGFLLIGIGFAFILGFALGRLTA